MPESDVTASDKNGTTAGESVGSKRRPDEPASRPTISTVAAEFVQMFVDYVRQETGDVVRDKVVLPTQKAGQVVAFALAAAGVLLLGIGYLSVAAMMVLADLIGWPGSLAAIGAVLVLGAAGLTAAKMKRVQR